MVHRLLAKQRRDRLRCRFLRFRVAAVDGYAASNGAATNVTIAARRVRRAAIILATSSITVMFTHSSPIPRHMRQPVTQSMIDIVRVKGSGIFPQRPTYGKTYGKRRGRADRDWTHLPHCPVPRRQRPIPLSANWCVVNPVRYCDMGRFLCPLC